VRRPYAGDVRILITRDEKDEVLRSEYRKVPPAIGWQRWLSVLRKRYVLPRTDVTAFLKRQEMKQRFAPVRKPIVARSQTSDSPLSSWGVDYFVMPESNGYTAVLTLIDRFSKITFLEAVKTQGATELIDVLDKWKAWLEQESGDPHVFDKVRRMHADNGASFRSQETQQWFARHHITLVHARAHEPTGSGLQERMNQTARRGISNWAHAEGRSWVKFVKPTQHLINTSYTRMLGGGRTPVQVAFASTPNEKLEVYTRQKRAAESRVSTKREAKIAIDEWVRVSLRRAGIPQQQEAFKTGQRKGSDLGWSEQTYKVRGRYGNQWMVHGLSMRLDAADLLPIPGPDADPYDRTPHAPHEATDTPWNPPSLTRVQTQLRPYLQGGTNDIGALPTTERRQRRPNTRHADFIPLL
jgi:transposase InsO family protein